MTGGTGFLGTNFYQYLRRKEPNIDVTLFSRRTGGNVRNYEQVKQAVSVSDLVVHMAAQTHVDFSLHDDLEDQSNFISTNVNGTLNVIHACRRYYVKMIHISTSEVYGTNQRPGSFMNEDHPIQAQAGIYATTKACADLTCRMTTMTTGADIVILRPFNFWGPYQSVEKLIPRFISQALAGKPLTIYGDGKQKRDYVYIEDVAKAVWLAKDLPSGTICNIATSKNYTVNEIANMISTDKVYVEARPGEVTELLGGFVKFHLLTGWEPKTELNKTSMKKLFDWYAVNKFIQQPKL